jgi:hypothetical protein
MKSFRILLLLLLTKFSLAQQVCPVDTIYPFTTDSVHLKIWNKNEYLPLFIKACNLGISVPGKQPGELDVSRAQYARWFSYMKEAGFNSIRLYTLHFPQFYSVLDSFNTANSKNPLYFFQGVWMEEELTNYANDLYFLDTSFTKEIEDNVSAVHGNRTIPQRLGKAYGNYSVDVSKWNIGYIIGRETQPIECLTTNSAHPQDTAYTGIHFSVKGNPTEIFITEKLDHLVNYENTNYNTQRPVSFSSWPTLDPLSHPLEIFRDEDTASVDLNTINTINAPAGYFASYHAYPYYPDFVSDDSLYQTYSDAWGPNSYLGYLSQLKNHYNKVPLIIAETGVPSSWGIAHYTSNGMNHGGFDEQKQGETILRLFHSVEDAGCGGGMNFAFMDEWFKRTWLTNNIDYDADRRPLWQNIMSAEQNFGLIGFKKPLLLETWASYDSTAAISKVKAAADYAYFHLHLSLGQPMQLLDDFWIAIDTYRFDLGESILPTGDTVLNRAEFLLHFTSFGAQLYVTQAYDIYGIYHQVSDSTQLYRSIATDGAPWLIERWKNNSGNNQVQFVGNLKVRNGFLPANSMDAITLYDDSVDIRLPWSLLHFTDPSRLTVFNDNRATTAPEDTTSDGIQITAFYHNQRTAPLTRYTWPTWNTALDVEEYKKTSFYLVKNGLSDFNNSALAMGDAYLNIDTFPFVVPANLGLLQNDMDLDGNFMQALLIGNAQHGVVSLNLDGSFSYQANIGYIGQDYFEYSVFDGLSLSKSVYVCLDVDNSLGLPIQNNTSDLSLKVYPNPANDKISLLANSPIEMISLYSIEGQLLFSKSGMESQNELDTSQLANGLYYIKTQHGKKILLTRLSVVH